MNQALKYALGLIIVIGVRMIPHVPNIEPITATLMPYAKRWGMWAGALFGALAVFGHDVLTGALGMWSLFTAGAYVLLGIAAGFFFARYSGKLSYVAFAIIGTLLFDAATGLTVGPLFFGQPFMQALVGQIPFTLMHLAGNVVLAFALSPLIERFIVANSQLETGTILARFAKQQ